LTCLLQRVEHEVCLHGTALAPTHDATAEHVNDEGHIDPALPGRDVGEVRDPQLIGSLSPELPVDAIKWAWRLRVSNGGALRLAPTHPLQALLAHQSLDGATRHGDTLSIELQPDLVCPIDLQVGMPHAVNLRHQACIALGTQRAQGRLTLARCMAPIR